MSVAVADVEIHTKRTVPDWKDRFLAALRRDGTIFNACEAANVSRANVYHRRNNDPVFAAEMAAAIEDSTDQLEREAIRRGCEGFLEPVVYQGKIMGHYVNASGKPCRKNAKGARFEPVTVRRYSDHLLSNLIKWRRYGEQVTVDIKGLARKIGSMTDEQIIAALRESGSDNPEAAPAN